VRGDRGKPALAMLGGSRAVPRGCGIPRWPVVTDREEDALRQVLASGKFTSAASGEREVAALERDWASLVGTRHCAAVSSGTAAISLAIAALGLRPGDEVIVPALSFIASAVAPLHVLAVPVFVDVHPRSFNLDPAGIEQAITPRTRAVLVVHLHGLPADMDQILAVARRAGLHVIEDAAQAHGAAYRGRQVGSMGVVNAFSLNVSKNLPTCGEGGLVTTDDAALHQRVVMMRQFGEVIPEEGERTYVSHLLGWNHKLGAVQAAFTRAQLGRFDQYRRLRERNVRRLLKRLDGLPGLLAPQVPSDREHAWHILRFRVDPAALGLDDVGPGPLRAALMRVLRAEGVPLSQYQLVPLPGQQVFQRGEGLGGGAPWSLPGARRPDYRIEAHPNAMAIVEDSFTIQKAHLSPEAGALLDRCADAFEKAWEHIDVIARIARAAPYRPPWSQVSAAGAAAVPHPPPSRPVAR
jgi:perosamine synthetase